MPNGSCLLLRRSLGDTYTILDPLRIGSRGPGSHILLLTNDRGFLDASSHLIPCLTLMVG
jgi:hypothetical protein